MSILKLSESGAVWNRREWMQLGGAALAAWPVLSYPESAFALRHLKVSDYPFSLGVASGDPNADGFVIWTRLAPRPLEDGGMPPETVQVAWQVAHDEAMTKVVAKGIAIATPELAHSVHVEVEGLEPGRWYFYQFAAAGEVSPKGRARTFPKADEFPERLRFAFASCQNWESGLYTAYQHLVREDLDLVVHLGDYIYERAGMEKQVRKHTEPLSIELADYRNRHAQYKTDEHLQTAHAWCPWLVTWDDHEVGNNYAGAISQNQEESPEQMLARRANAYKAYYEHMPLRIAQLPTGPDMRLYRHIPFGRLAEFSLLDTRQYRSPQPCGDGVKPPCDAVFSPERTLLGEAQEQWLVKTLDKSPAAWNVLAQQVMMARVDFKPGEGSLHIMDQWPGYEANRQRLLTFFGQRATLNPVVITGDIHSNWVNNLQIDSSDENSAVVATEFVGTSISSGGNGIQSNETISKILSENPFVRFCNAERGYVSCDVTAKHFTSHYRTVPFVDKADAPLVTRAAFVVERDQPGAQPA